jgi:glucokinase
VATPAGRGERAGSPGPGDRAIAVDIGGTKLAVGLVDGTGTVLSRRTAPTPATDGDRMWAVLRDLVDAARADGDAVVVGIGSGGPMSERGELVSPLNIPGWRDFPLRSRLAEHTGLPAAIDNDAKALARAEGWVGAARGASDYLAMVVSTGVGGGLVLDGRLLDGADGNAGHIGHVIVEPDGRRCECGARGCLEAEASGTAIAAALGRPAADAPADVRRRTGTLVGRAVASVANLLDLRLAVVAGSVALGYGADFFGAAQVELDRSARLDFSRGARIVPSGCVGDGPLIGAGAVGFAALGLDVGPVTAG